MDSDQRILHLMQQIKDAEELIIESRPVHLFTWAPNPKKFPRKHDMVYNYYYHLKNYFDKWHQCMYAFAICPELTLNGNVHYHGWYQLKDNVKWHKSLLPKLKYAGFVKIDEAKFVEIHSWDAKDNSLHYYKKDADTYASIFAPWPVPFTSNMSFARFKTITKKRTIVNAFNYEQYLKDTFEHDEENIRYFLRIV